MLTRIDVTQDIIDHAVHDSCANCMLGVAINRVLNDESGCGVYLNVENSHEIVEINKIKGETWEEKPGFINYNLDWRGGVSLILPQIAIDAANKFEGEGDYKDKGTSREIEPFSFYLDIPEKYLRG